MERIIIPYKPRDIFLPYHSNTKRFCVTIAHRRAGKTVARINKLIREAAKCDKQNPKFAYLAPYYVQAKDIAWLYLKHYAEPILNLEGSKVNESELSVTFGHNGATIKLYGAENAERMRGLYQDGIVVDEGQGIKKTVLTQIILPSLADRKGWLDVSGTPKGWGNLLGELYKIAQKDPAWFSQLIRASESGIIDNDELSRQRELMSENEYAQEFECSFDAAIDGAVYGKQIADADKAGRLVSGLYDPALKVNTSWDLGYDDSTAIVFWQKPGNEVRVIDCYENNGQTIEFYCNIIKDRGYNYDTHYVPHDAANKLLAAGGRSIVQQMIAFGMITRIVPATSQMNGIEAARKVFETTWFDKDTCEPLIDSLRQYQFQFDADRKTYRSTPKHDWSSHFCDAFEIIGQVLRESKNNAIVKPKFLEDATVNEIFWGEQPTRGSRI
jgi:phage terminase large subunit